MRSPVFSWRRPWWSHRALQAVAADAPAVPATDALDEIVVTATKTGAES
jgi:hypothetical protein